MATTSPKRKRRQHKIIGHLGVDAGLMYLGDPCCIPKDAVENWDEFINKNINNENLVADGVAWAIDRTRYGLSKVDFIDMGIVVPTGMGDGIYPVIATI